MINDVGGCDDDGDNEEEEYDGDNDNGKLSKDDVVLYLVLHFTTGPRHRCWRSLSMSSMSILSLYKTLIIYPPCIFVLELVLIILPFLLMIIIMTVYMIETIKIMTELI